MSMTTATTVGPSSDHAGADASPRWLTEQPALLDASAEVTVLRRRASVPMGGLATGELVGGRRLVAASDLDDAPCWVAASTVWSDAEENERPEHPLHAGLAT